MMHSNFILFVENAKLRKKKTMKDCVVERNTSQC